MSFLGRILVITALAVGSITALAGPASAATPALSLASGPFAPDATLLMLGSGCPANSDVSFDIWDTAKPPSHVVMNSIRVADSSGNFGMNFPLNNRFDPGAQIGIFFSCTEILDWTAGASLILDPPLYRWIEMAESHATIVPPTDLTYGVPKTVLLRTDAVFGSTTFTLDGGVVDYIATESHYGYWFYPLPSTLAPGPHQLHATWQPSEPGAPQATANLTIVVTKIAPLLDLAVSKSRIKRRKPLLVAATLASTGIAPAVGSVVVKDGARVIATIAITEADHGVKQVKVRLKKKGRRHLQATFQGSDLLASAVSQVRTVRVRR